MGTLTVCASPTSATLVHVCAAVQSKQGEGEYKSEGVVIDNYTQPVTSLVLWI